MKKILLDIYRKILGIREFIYSYIYIRINKLIFPLNGVQISDGFGVIGPAILNIHKQASVNIGSCFFMSSGRFNPLSSNKKASIAVRQGASLIIGEHCGFSSPTIEVRNKIVIGNNIILGANVILLDSDCHSLNYKDRQNPIIDKDKSKSLGIQIGSDGFIGMNVLNEIKIGDKSIICANVVVTKDIPENSFAAGNPARIIKDIL